MDHAKEARDHLHWAEHDAPSDDPDAALLLATVGVGHALLAISAQLNAIARAAGTGRRTRPASQE